MKIAVIGAGAIGCVTGAYLAKAGEEVLLVGRADNVAAVNTKGLRVTGVRGDFTVKVRATQHLREEMDLILIATKTQDILEAAEDAGSYILGRPLVTMQNGVRNDEILARIVPKKDIISSVVMYAATFTNPGEVEHNFEGDLILGRAFGPNDPQVERVAAVLKQAFPVMVAPNIHGVHWMKLILNLNNALWGIVGRPMQEVFKNVEVCRLSVGLIREAVEVMDTAGIKLEPLPGFDQTKLRGLTNMPPEAAAQLYQKIMLGLTDKPITGSILQSIQRGKKSEIDYLNGEIVHLAREHHAAAPLNSYVVDLVHRVEDWGRFVGTEELLKNVPNAEV